MGDSSLWIQATELLDAADQMRVTTATAAPTGSIPTVVDVDGGGGTLYIAALVDKVKSFPDALAAQGEVMANAVTLAVWDAVRADTMKLPEIDPAQAVVTVGGAVFTGAAVVWALGT